MLDPPKKELQWSYRQDFAAVDALLMHRFCGELLSGRADRGGGGVGVVRDEQGLLEGS